MMSPRTKSLLMLLGALLIGALLGGLIHARMVEKRFHRIEQIRTERGFVRDVERVVEPEDDEQRAAVRRILRDAADRLARERREMREEVHLILDSTRTALDSVLTEEQMARLEKHVRANRPGIHGRRGRRQPE